MKGSTQHSPQEELDLLLFEYLEGNLPEKECKALEQRLAADPLLREELDSWKETFIAQGFYNTEVLEEKLLTVNQQPEIFSFSISLNTVVLTVMTVIFSFMPITDKRKNPFTDTPERNALALKVHTAQGRRKEPANIFRDKEAGEAKEDKMKSAIEKAPFALAKREEPSRVQAENTPQMLAEREKLWLPSIKMIAIEQPVNTAIKTIEGVYMMPQKVARQETAHKISRKQQRMIERKKEKTRQQRQAREFMKGNVPYVVPLNSQNF